LNLSNLVHCIFHWFYVSYCLNPPSCNNLAPSFIFVCHVCIEMRRCLKKVTKLTSFVFFFSFFLLLFWVLEITSFCCVYFSSNLSLFASIFWRSEVKRLFTSGLSWWISYGMCIAG
jgi:hypothetical protein